MNVDFVFWAVVIAGFGFWKFVAALVAVSERRRLDASVELLYLLAAGLIAVLRYAGRWFPNETGTDPHWLSVIGIVVVGVIVNLERVRRRPPGAGLKASGSPQL